MHLDRNPPPSAIGDYFPCELTEPDQIEAIVNNVAARYQRIDGIINNAGVNDESAQHPPLFRSFAVPWNAISFMHSPSSLPAVVI